MVKLIFVKHKNLSDSLLQSICEIKSSAWDYSIDEQKKWINDNIKDLDIHVLLKVDEDYVSYLNLVNIELLDGSNKLIDALGIGNVCSRFQNKGYGTKLIKGVNLYLTSRNKMAILFCKEKLINFYEKNNYKLKNKIENNIFLMSYNCNGIDFEYQGRLF